MSKKLKPFLAHSELTDCIYIIDGNDKYEVTEQCISAMKATNRMPRWIPVSERLPEIGQNVLIDTVGYGLLTGKYENTKYGDIEEGTFLTYYSLGSSKIVSVEVIAWMPLPEPYKQEVEE